MPCNGACGGRGRGPGQQPHRAATMLRAQSQQTSMLDTAAPSCQFARQPDACSKFAAAVCGVVHLAGPCLPGPCHTHQKKCGQPQNSSVVTQAHAGESASGGSTARGAAGDPRLCGTRSRVQRSARFPSFLLGRGCLAHRAALIAAAAQRDLQLRAAAAVHALPAGTGKVGRRSVCRRTAGIVQVRVQPHDLQPRASTPTNNGKHTCLRAWLQLPPKRKEQQLSPHTAPAPAGCAAPPAARAAPCPGQPAPVGEGGRAGESSHEL